VITVDSVPVAERLLQTKLFGVPVRRLAHAVAVPLSPGVLASMVGLRIGIVGPLLVVGLAVGTVLFYRTPQGQSPFAWVQGAMTWVLGPDRSFWKPVRQEDTPSAWLERWRSTGETRTREPTDRASTSRSILGDGNTADQLDFDYVRDDGVVVTPTGCARLLELEATPWLILDESSRESTISAFERYLSGVGSAIQFLSIPVPFDVEPHRSTLDECTRRCGTDSSILQTGRDRHGRWLERVVRDGAIRDRRHFLVVSVPKDDGTRLTGIESAESDAADALDELAVRADNARTSLPRTGVDVSVLSDRQSVLDVLYRYYRGASPPDDLDHGWLTRRGRPEGKQ
jgi:hypothetical protein